jgi:hypothetical protein
VQEKQRQEQEQQQQQQQDREREEQELQLQQLQQQEEADADDQLGAELDDEGTGDGARSDAGVKACGWVGVIPRGGPSLTMKSVCGGGGGGRRKGRDSDDEGNRGRGKRSEASVKGCGYKCFMRMCVYVCDFWQ